MLFYLHILKFVLFQAHSRTYSKYKTPAAIKPVALERRAPEYPKTQFGYTLDYCNVRLYFNIERKRFILLNTVNLFNYVSCIRVSKTEFGIFSKMTRMPNKFGENRV